jgi:hypothetical protein
MIHAILGSMPSPEQPQPESEAPKELPAYHQAARYRNERPAGKAYTKAQELIYKRSDVDLSAYRLLVKKQWHVSVLGEMPPEEVDKRVRQILASGEPATLPEEILRVLHHRRLLAKQVAPWVEAHHTPGMEVDLGEPGKQQE